MGIFKKKIKNNVILCFRCKKVISSYEGGLNWIRYQDHTNNDTKIAYFCDDHLPLLVTPKKTYIYNGLNFLEKTS